MRPKLVCPSCAAVLFGKAWHVASERTAHRIGLRPGVGVSAKVVEKAPDQLDQRLGVTGFDEAMRTALVVIRTPYRASGVADRAGLVPRCG